MAEKGRKLADLIRENKMLRLEIADLKCKIAFLNIQITRWEHCHRQDMADNLRLRNQIAMLMGWDPVPGGTNEEN